jgi:hypothetical protein
MRDPLNIPHRTSTDVKMYDVIVLLLRKIFLQPLLEYK